MSEKRSEASRNEEQGTPHAIPSMIQRSRLARFINWIHAMLSIGSLSCLKTCKQSLCYVQSNSSKFLVISYTKIGYLTAIQQKTCLFCHFDSFWLWCGDVRLDMSQYANLVKFYAFSEHRSHNKALLLSPLTPPIAEIICVKNVGAIGVCGFLMK